MSIPQICPSCGNHISAAHATNCCYGTPEYAHIGWPSASDGVALINIAHPILRRVHSADSAGTLSMEELVAASDAALDKFKKLKEQENATAIRRLLEYLEEEPEAAEQSGDRGIDGELAFTAHAVLVLTKRADELRKEAAGISLIESRAKRVFAADILDGIISELTE